MNAAVHFAAVLERPAQVRLVGRRAAAARGLDRALAGAFSQDLVSLLNRARRADLERMAARFGIERGGSVGALRLALWRRGAELEAGGAEHIGRPWQPLPAVLGGRLVHLAPVRGLAPPALRLPRPVPPRVALERVAEMAAREDEPESLEELLERASRLLGVRLGRPVRDKGRYGSCIAALLGVAERGASEPDWRGQVELKTVPVAREGGGLWRVVEDPAVSMADVAPEGKLGRVLWIARVADAGDSPVLSWYYQERDAELARLARRCLHTRPKGPRGARSRGWYLHKRFFAGSGFLRTLNGGGTGAEP